MPLHSACLSGNLALVQYFLTEHADTVLKQLDFPNKVSNTECFAHLFDFYVIGFFNPILFDVRGKKITDG